MCNENFILATQKRWNIKLFNEKIKHYPGIWHLITDPLELNIDKIKAIQPKYIFFPHWSFIVPNEILNISTCICFHETDLPFGRGGSPLQNLISCGIRETVITAFKMVEELDAGPVYMKKPLSLEGLAEEIFLRAACTTAEMIREIIIQNVQPEIQTGEPVFFTRRKPSESKISNNLNDLEYLFDHIRMLDAEGYPKAFIELGSFRYEISRPALKSDEILADVRITRIKKDSQCLI